MSNQTNMNNQFKINNHTFKINISDTMAYVSVNDLARMINADNYLNIQDALSRVPTYIKPEGTTAISFGQFKIIDIPKTLIAYDDHAIYSSIKMEIIAEFKNKILPKYNELITNYRPTDEDKCNDIRIFIEQYARTFTMSKLDSFVRCFGQKFCPTDELYAWLKIRYRNIFDTVNTDECKIAYIRSFITNYTIIFDIPSWTDAYNHIFYNKFHHMIYGDMRLWLNIMDNYSEWLNN